MNPQAHLEQLKTQNHQLRLKIEAMRKASFDTKLSQAAAGIAPIPDPKFRLRKSLQGHAGNVFGMGWAPNSQHLATVAQDETVIVWNALTGNKTHIHSFATGFGMSVSFHPREPILAVGSMDTSITILRMLPSGQMQPITSFHGHKGYVSSLCWLNTRKLVSSGGRTCAMWDLETKQLDITYEGHSSLVMATSPAPDGSAFLSGSCDNTAMLWNPNSRDPVYVYEGHSRDINSIEFFPTGLSFATGSDDGKCGFFDIRADRLITTFGATSSLVPVNSVSFSRTGRLLFAAYENATVRAFDTLKGVDVWDFQCHQSPIKDVKVSPNGHCFATRALDSDVRIWA